MIKIPIFKRTTIAALEFKLAGLHLASGERKGVIKA